ncbi:tail fiber protein [Caulobacter segnis]|uniref:tail fiber protein n=1 Tax=Caulobacter segnis TaxID=88688 RepID=UPI0024108123|nr:tail fiber protein [Caulobacter segnis]MDG2520606.1 tail fiber protein [Caulobacter segnis]
MALNNLQPSLVLGTYFVLTGEYPERMGQGETVEPLGHGGYTIGFIRTTGFGWAEALPADGVPMPVARYVNAYSVIGVNFGGNGVHDFRLPNLAGRISADDGANHYVGDTAGASDVYLIRPNLPASVGGSAVAVQNEQPALTVKWLVRVGVDEYGLAGELAQFAGPFAPNGFVEANGQSLSKADYPELYAKLGDRYGADATTFKVPDMTGRTAIGVDPSKGLELGETIGSEAFVITTANLPTVRGGQGAAIDNHAPSMAVNYYIATQGIFPSRDVLDDQQIYVGEIRAFAGAPPEAGWLPLDGRSVGLGTYQALFALLGTRFGGNGTTAFNLPDLRGRAVVGFGQGQDGQTYSVGQQFGSPTINLLESDLGLYRPVNTAPGEVTLDADGQAAFSGAQALTVRDMDTANLTVTLTVSNGSLTDGTNTGAVLTRSGHQSDLNTWLSTLVYTPAVGAFAGASLTITTSDGSAQDVDMVAIKGIPNEAPVIDAGQRFTIGENQTSIGVVKASDAEDDAITYALVTGQGAQAHNALVTINPTSGALSFKSAPDFERGPVNLTINIIATDAAGRTSAPQTVSITVTDVNEAPVITSLRGGTSATTSTTENTTAVGVMTASDQDAGTALAWSIDGGADAARFVIDEATGALAFVDAPDFETPASAAGTNDYVVRIKVSDGQLSSLQTITVKVADANDNAPVLSGAASATVSENIAASTVLRTITATDVDTVGGPVVLTLGGADASFFELDTSGRLRFKASPDFEAPRDADADNVYALSITAGDGAGTISHDFTITVQDANDAPRAVTLSNLPRLEEGQQTDRIRLADITIDDDDLGDNQIIIDGPHAALFEIVDGALHLRAGVELDFETTPAVQARIVVTDPTLPDAISVERIFTLHINNINEAPRITSNAAVSINENNQSVVTVAGSDPDAGTTLTYSIVGGDDAGLFEINSATGVLRFRAAPDFEVPQSAAGDNFYRVQVQASDGLLAASQTISVQVVDVNDTDPRITSATSASVREGASPATAIYIATATDPDTTGETIRFSLGGADAAHFTIDASGEVRFITAPSFAAPADAGGDNIYDLVLTASDGLNSAHQALTIRVTAQPQPEPEPDPEPEPPAPQPGSEPDFVQTIGGALGADLTGDKALSPTVILPDGRVAPNPLYETAQAVAALQAQLRAGLISPRAALEQIVQLSAPTLGVAADAYTFFTGSAPSEAGMAWLIDSPDNQNDLTDPYYAAFSVENRYINFAVNLGKNGEGRAAFEADYGPLSFEQAIDKAYDAIIGEDEAREAGVDVAAAHAYIASQQAYFMALGGDALGAKAAMVGYILAAGTVGKVGQYYEALEDRLDDQVGLAGIGTSGAGVDIGFAA